MSNRKTRLALAVAAVLALPASAFATNGIIPAGNGMVSQGMGGAGLANAGEAAAGMDNPALISQTGNAIGAGWTIFSPERKIDTTGVPGYGPYSGVVKSDSTMFAIPQAAFTARINSDMNWGIMAYAMGGMNTDYRTGPFPGAPGGSTPQGVNLQGLILAPTMSYSVNPDVAVGASLLLGYETLTIHNLFGQGAPGTGQGTATGVGVKLGVDAKVADGVEVGAMFQPKLSMGEMNYFKSFLGGFGFTGNAGLDLPTEYGVGAKFAVGPSVDILADALYYDWNGVDLFKFFGWKSEPVYKIGAEFRPTDSLALRIGYNYGKSPIQGGDPAVNGSMDAAFANYPFPAISQSHITLGVGYKLDSKATVNAYYLYAPSVTETATLTSMTSGGAVPGGTKVSMSQNAFGIGVNYAF